MVNPGVCPSSMCDLSGPTLAAQSATCVAWVICLRPHRLVHLLSSDALTHAAKLGSCLLAGESESCALNIESALLTNNILARRALREKEKLHKLLPKHLAMIHMGSGFRPLTSWRFDRIHLRTVIVGS